MRKVLLLIPFLFYTSMAWAVEIGDLYQSEVRVASQSVHDRADAIKTAFQNVLIKVSGNTDIATIPAIQQMLEHIDPYIQQYSYHEIPGDDENQRQLKLNVIFEKQAMNRLLHQSGQGVWGSDRPVVTVWTALADHWFPRLLNAEVDQTFATVLDKAAMTRGLKLVLPLMDLRDISQVSINDVWHLNRSVIFSASSRYHADAAFVGRISQIGDRWYARWTLLLHGEQIRWEVDGVSFAEVIQQGVDRVADALAKRFAVLDRGMDAGSMVLTIRNIDSEESYAAVLGYLEGLAPVEAVEVLSVGANEVVYQLKLVGNTDSLLHAISLNPKLVPVSDFQEGTQLEYEYLS